MKFPSDRIRTGLIVCVLFLAGFGQSFAESPLRAGNPQVQNPELLGPVNLLVPWDIRHVSHNWTTGLVRLRIGSDGLVKDWIPIDLPHYKLIPAIDRALADARFSPPLQNGEAVTVDMPAEIPLLEAISYRVISETLAEHVESLQARMNPRQYQVVVSLPSGLDDPLTLLSGHDGYQVVDDVGNVLSGRAVVSFYVGPQGIPHMIRVEETSDPDLVQAAFMTVQEFRFVPPKRNRQPTVVRARIPVVFGES